MIKLKDILTEADEDILVNLNKRGVDISKSQVVVDKESNKAYFFLYNLSGKIVGYQSYNPNGEKKLQDDPRLGKYYTKTFEKQIAVWGLNTYDWKGKILFIVEGIMDCVKIHNAGYPAIATLTSTVDDKTRRWLATLPQKRIVICDNDDAGRKLARCGNVSFTVPDPYKDLGEMPQPEVNVFLKSILK